MTLVKKGVNFMRFFNSWDEMQEGPIYMSL